MNRNKARYYNLALFFCIWSSSALVLLHHEGELPLQVPIEPTIEPHTFTYTVSLCYRQCQIRNVVKFSSHETQMSTICRKDPEGYTCAKEKVSPEKSTEAELWLNMMTSMLNFAMASTTLMKSIQNRVEVTKKLEEEARAMRAEEFFRQELAKSMPDKTDASEDFSLRSEPVREDTCAQHTCTLFFRKEPDECGPTCDGKKSAPKKLSQLSKKKKPCQESVSTIGGSCLCLIPVPEEPDEEEKTDEPKEDEDRCSCEMLKACMATDEDDDEACVCSDDEEKEEGTKVICEPRTICPASLSFDEYDRSDNCSCPSLGCKDNVAEPEEPPVVEEEPPAPTEEKVEEDVESIIDCGCQTSSSEQIMVKELQLANLTYQLRQTDRNLKELKREMDRISNFVGGKKKCSYAKAAALYEEIMKPRTPLEEVNKPKSRRRTR